MCQMFWLPRMTISSRARCHMVVQEKKSQKIWGEDKDGGTTYGSATEDEHAEEGNMPSCDDGASSDGNIAVESIGHESKVREQQAGLETPDSDNVAEKWVSPLSVDLLSPTVRRRGCRGSSKMGSYNSAPMYCTCCINHVSNVVQEGSSNQNSRQVPLPSQSCTRSLWAYHPGW